MNTSLIATFSAGLSAVFVLVILLHFVFIAPIKRLICHFTEIARSADTSVRLSMSRRDEIGRLAREFDHMVERLDLARKKLLEKSYLSGMAEMSSAVLHNARNSLSPIMSCIDRLRQQLKGVPMEKLQIAQVELGREKVSSERREDLSQFVTLVSKSLLDVVQDTQVNLDDLCHQVHQMEEMLAGQKTFRNVEKPIENVALESLFHEAINLVPANVRKYANIEIDKSVTKLPCVKVHRVALLQIFQNLLINAAESLSSAKPLYPNIKIEGRIEKIEGTEMIHLYVTDNGNGISPEKLNQIFERGVSSKRKGLTGIGLHWCANTVSAMDGRLYAESRGEQSGACFHILLPAPTKASKLLVEKEE